MYAPDVAALVASGVPLLSVVEALEVAGRWADLEAMEHDDDGCPTCGEQYGSCAESCGECECGTLA